jgi:hypothetical protein
MTSNDFSQTIPRAPGFPLRPSVCVCSAQSDEVVGDEVVVVVIRAPDDAPKTYKAMIPIDAIILMTKFDKFEISKL